MNDIDENGGGPGLLFDLSAKIEAYAGAVKDMTTEMKRPKKRRPPAQPVFGRIAANEAAPSSGILVLPLYGPQQGYFWFIRSIVVGGLTPTTSTAGRADVFVSASDFRSQTTLAAIGLGDWRDQVAALPAVAFYGRGELPLRMNEELFIVISSGTNAQQYVAAIQFEQFEEAANAQEWGI